MLLAQAGQTIVRTLDTNLVVRLLICYDLDRQSRYELLERLVRTRGVVVDDIDAVLDALEQFRQGGNQADRLILARAARIGALPVLSFDLRCSSCEGVELLVAEASP